MINFIVNAHSGRGKGQQTLKKIINFCYKNNIEYTVHLTSAVGHATRIARALCENNSRTLVAVGGDGTFHEVLTGIIDPKKTTLGFIPSGRGNDFARGTGIPLDPVTALEKIARAMKDGAIRDDAVKMIDYIEVGGERCLNVAGTGLDIDVLRRVAGRHGKLTYINALIYCLKHFEPYEISITNNGVTTDYNAIMAGVCNGRQFGGGIKISPLSDVCDGAFNVVVMNMPNDKRIFKLLPRFVKGKHLNMPITTHYTAEEVKITAKKPYPVQIDGEIYQDLCFECRIVKGGLRTFDLD